LFGAGASRAVGETYGYATPINGDFFKILGNHERIVYGNIERMLKTQFLTENQQLMDLTLEQAEDYVAKTSDIYRKQLQQQMNKAIHILLSQYAQTADPNIWANVTYRRDDKPNLQLYWLLIDSLSTGDILVTLNYDILLDIALLSRGRDIYYGVPIGYIRRPDNPGRDQDLQLVTLYKPHGSQIGWETSLNPLLLTFLRFLLERDSALQTTGRCKVCGMRQPMF
jgi:hypothetical protein